MREILFRGKRIDNGEWLCGNLTVWSDGSASLDKEPTEASPLYAVDPETVGQYTGLTANGKKIFEGDIIKSCENDDVYFVKYCADDNYPAFDVVPEINIECNGLSHLHIVEGIEVIGNIHDNPELLKGGAE